jgi:hypothetical protein
LNGQLIFTLVLLIQMIGLNFEAWSLGFCNLVTAKTKQRDDNEADTMQHHHGRGKHDNRRSFSHLSNEEEASLGVEYKLSNGTSLT